MPKKSDDVRAVNQFKVSYPSADKQVSDWINAQHNLSASVRMLIKTYVAKHGFTDATCQPLTADDLEVRTRRVREPKPEVSETQAMLAQKSAPIQLTAEEPLTAAPAATSRFVEVPTNTAQAPVQPVYAAPIQPAPAAPVYAQPAAQSNFEVNNNTDAGEMLADLLK